MVISSIWKNKNPVQALRLNFAYFCFSNFPLNSINNMGSAYSYRFQQLIVFLKREKMNLGGEVIRSSTSIYIREEVLSPFSKKGVSSSLWRNINKGIFQGQGVKCVRTEIDASFLLLFFFLFCSFELFISCFLDLFLPIFFLFAFLLLFVCLKT